LETVKLSWYGPFLLEEFSEWEISDEVMGVYMLLDSERNEERRNWVHHAILYIGMVYEQTFLDRIKQHLRGDDAWTWIEKHHEYEVTIKVARVMLLERQRISKQLLQDTESLLIGVEHPGGNVQSTKTYAGPDLEIRNTRKYNPLGEIISTEDLQ
jgi:hypothetical protein